MTEKVCPLFFAASIVAGRTASDQAPALLCKGPRCQWWTGTYTTEGQLCYDCSISLNAQQGRIVV